MTLNKVFLIGNVGTDPEIRTVQGGAKNATFRLATNTRYKDRSGTRKEETEWHSVTVWNNKAEFVEKYVHKGETVYIEGKIKTRQWTDQQGDKHYATEIVANEIQKLTWDSSAQDDGDDLPL